MPWVVNQQAHSNDKKQHAVWLKIIYENKTNVPNRQNSAQNNVNDAITLWRKKEQEYATSQWKIKVQNRKWSLGQYEYHDKLQLTLQI